MKTLNYKEKNFSNKLNKHLFLRYEKTNSELESLVNKIINEVKLHGDDKLVYYAKKFDNVNILNSEIQIHELKKYYSLKSLDKDTIESFNKAIKNIKLYHEKQLPNDYEIVNFDAKLKSIWKPLDSVGIYIPGGSAIYPSSLIMSVIPALIAGVKRIVCITPPSKNINPYLMYLLDILEINEVYQVGGAQGIAALAYGTKTIKSVNKIFGPGNAYVAAAKKQVFGKVGIDIIAGPSEIIVVADESNNPKWIASDLMAQAEHDENAQSILITNSKTFRDRVLTEIENLLSLVEKKETITKSLKKNGLIIIMDDLLQSFKVINNIAPEHLHLQCKKKYQIFDKINNAGGIFLGEYSTEAFGDYIVGTNHVLPTFGTAKFSSGLGVLDFMKRNSVVEMDKSSFNKLSKDVENIADVENLSAHKLSVKIRQT